MSSLNNYGLKLLLDICICQDPLARFGLFKRLLDRLVTKTFFTSLLNRASLGQTLSVPEQRFVLRTGHCSR
jgi:hypothetical protein